MKLCSSEIVIKLTKTHRVLKSKQSDWLKTYIGFNTEKRKNAVNSFEKNFFKLMINSVKKKKIVNVRLANNAKDYIKYVSKPSFVSEKAFSKDHVAIHEIKPF